MNTRTKSLAIVLSTFMLVACNAWSQFAEAPPVRVPAATNAPSLEKVAGTDTLVVAGGCFWGVQAVFQHVHGVRKVVSGYAGGERASASYRQVSSGMTGHAESVEITFDPAQISITDLLRVYFSVAHNPIEVNRQGPDEGSQYRSAVFYHNDNQRRLTESYIAQLNGTHLFAAPIATQVNELRGFYAAENYHQDYATLHPESSYISHFDLPKLQHLKALFPELYQEKPVLVGTR